MEIDSEAVDLFMFIIILLCYNFVIKNFYFFYE
jgi:hypothetical protein